MKPILPQERKIARITEFVKLLAHPVRIRIIQLLSQQRELSVGAIYQHISQEISLSLIYTYARQLERKGMLTSTRRGTEFQYALADPVFGEWVTLLLTRKDKQSTQTD